MAPSGASLALAAAVAAPAWRARVERAVEEVFADPAFREGLDASHGDFETWSSYVSRLILRLFLEALAALEDLYAARPLLFWLLMAVLAAVLVLLLAHIGWTLREVFHGRPRGAAGVAPGETERRVKRCEELRREAREAASRGRSREAARLLLLALLALASERRILEVARSWTNREIAARLRRQGITAPSLERFAAAVDEAVYGSGRSPPLPFSALDGLLEEVAWALVSPGGSAGGGRG